MNRKNVRTHLLVTTAFLTSLLGAPAVFAGDRQVHVGTVCQQGDFEGSQSWRSTTGYLANNSGSTKTFICPAINDTFTSGLTAATINVGGNASCYASTTNWGTTNGAISAIKTHPGPGVGQLVLGALNTPGGDIFGGYTIVCNLSNNAYILQYFINQK